MNTLQLEEIYSWRIVTELWRRFPSTFTLIEAHPGGGMSDVLALMTKHEHPKFAISINRQGSIHIDRQALGSSGESIPITDWVERMRRRAAIELLDEICMEGRLTAPPKLPTSTPTTIIYRFITEFLTHSLGRLETWECRNGYEDTSGYGVGKREHLFQHFPTIDDNDPYLRETIPFLDQFEYNFWFLLKDSTPVLCLDTNGVLHKKDGSKHDLAAIYKKKKRIWPLIVEVAGEVLP